MNKVTRILLAIGLILAVATPALAEFKLNGLYRLISYAEEKKATSTSTDEEGTNQNFIDQRFRAKLTYTLNDNVAVVYFGEVDTVWGEESKGNIGDGGQVTVRTSGADGVNIETKNVYLDLKIGDTAVGLGIQNLSDAFDGIVFNDDIPALKITHKIGNTTLSALYSKWDEDYASGAANVQSNRKDWDDLDFYALEAKHKFGDSFTAGLGVYYADDNRDDQDGTDLFFYGLNAAARFGTFGIDGFVMAQDGEDETANEDIKGMAATVKGTMKLANGDVGLRAIYFSEDDDDQDEMRWQGFQGEFFLNNDTQLQFLEDKFSCNDGKEMYAIRDAVDQGYGLLAFVLSGNHKLPQDMYLNWGAGYYMAMDEERDDEGVDSREGDSLGYEIAARLGKKFLEKVDVSLNASYADYGDFYDNTVAKDGVANSGDPDSTFKTYLMVNVPF